uniref:BPI2 domain-containing protein n=1 Tax=Heterorhabditis bacteriophora TaxID=37862 RepID=A0A1I7WUM7_HETBA
MLQTAMKSLRHIRQDAALQAVNLRSPRSTAIRRRNEEIHRKQRAHRQSNFHLITNTFNLSHVDNLFLDYGILSPPSVTKLGVEIETSGEISAAHIRTPFGPRPLVLPLSATEDMLQVVVSDYVPNTLMYHGHRTGLFNTRVDSSTPQFGSLMQTTCDLSTGSLFCVGDLFPTLRDMVISFFSILSHFIFVLTTLATMKMKLTAKTVRGRVNLKTIRLVCFEDECEESNVLEQRRKGNNKYKLFCFQISRFRLVFSLNLLTLLDRSMLLETDFQLNQELIRQLTVEKLTFA